MPEGGRVKKFVLMHKEFDADESEMTRTRKLRRGYLADHYQNIIDSIYSDQEKVTVSAVVHYQDGRQAVVETGLRIMRLEEESSV